MFPRLLLRHRAPRAISRAGNLRATVPLLASGSSSVLTGFLLAALVLGYVVLWAIWHFFFRGRGD
jgi:hypothetical protein